MRPNVYEYYLDIAKAVSMRSNCIKRQYGAVIVKNKEIIATGYNGSPRDEPNCCDIGICNRENIAHNTGDYAECKSVHAEQNAMLSASRQEMIGSTLYIYCRENDKKILDFSPCPICQRMIKNAGIEKVITPNYVYDDDSYRKRYYEEQRRLEDEN